MAVADFGEGRLKAAKIGQSWEGFCAVPDVTQKHRTLFIVLPFLSVPSPDFIPFLDLGLKLEISMVRHFRFRLSHSHQAGKPEHLQRLTLELSASKGYWLVLTPTQSPKL